MEDGLLSLKWNNHKSTFFHILSSLRKKETYTDATIACEGQFFPVHKLVMSTCSDYFSEIFERTNCKSPVVILKDIKHRDLEALLDYMYLGEVDVKQSELAGLIKAAECLRIKGLAVPDEDPTLSQRKAPHVPEHRSSPAAKRLRKESGSCIDNSSHHHHYTNKSSKSLSPSRSHSSSSLTSTSVPSQSVNSDTLSQVPSLSMLPPSYSDTRHIDLSSSTVTDSQKHIDQSSLVPVDMIKVEVEDEGNNNSQLRQSREGPHDHRGGREEAGVTEEGGREDGIEAGHRDKETLSNNFSENSGGNTADIEKEEHDQLEYFNGSDQIPGPSGVQGGSQIMNWSEEEGNFPHNLFGSDDSSHQQVCIAIMEPEMLAVRMFQGTKPQHLPNHSQLQFLGERSSVQLATVNQPVEASTTSHAQFSTVQHKNPEPAHIVVYHQNPSIHQVDYQQKQKCQQFQQVEVHSVHSAPLSLSSSNISMPTSLCSKLTASGLEYPVSSVQITSDKPALQIKKKSRTQKKSSRPRNSSARKKILTSRQRPSLEQHSPKKVGTLLHDPGYVTAEGKLHIHESQQPVQFSVNLVHQPEQQNIEIKERVCVNESSLPEELQDSSRKYVSVQNISEHFENKLPIEEQEQILKSPYQGTIESQGSPSSIESSSSVLPQDLSSRHHRLHFCPYCQYHSKSKVDLNKHVRIHTREKPYKCSMCKYETGDKSNYKRHISTVHKFHDTASLPLSASASSSFVSSNQPPSHGTVSSDSGEGDSNAGEQQLRFSAVEIFTPYSHPDLPASPGASQNIG